MAQTFEIGREVGGIGGGEPKVGHGGMPAVQALHQDVGEVADGKWSARVRKDGASRIGLVRLRPTAWQRPQCARVNARPRSAGEAEASGMMRARMIGADTLAMA